MPNIVCPTVLKQCLPCNDDPIRNISAEDADSDRFLFNFDIFERPPLGYTFEALGCKEWCYSEESLFDAQLCAVQQSTECIIDTWRPPQTGEPPFPPPAPPAIFTNQQQFCETTCPDGSTFGATIPAGRVSALSQAQANLTAASLACQRARELRICIGASSPLNGACVGTAYSNTLRARGGVPWVMTFENMLFAPFCANPGDRFPYVWTIISGSLPDGLELGECSGTISGTPTATGTYIFTVRATDYLGSFQTKQFTMTVAQITTATPLPNGGIGNLYTQNLTVAPAHDQETEVWSVTAGTLPPGITLTAAGVLTGTPTGSSDITYQFTAHVAFIVNGASAVCEKSFTLSISTTPISYWKFDDAANSTRVDTVGGANLTDDNSNVGSVAGLIANAAHFQLSAIDALETVPNVAAQYFFSTGWTFAGWINVDVLDDGDVFTLDNGALLEISLFSPGQIRFAYRPTVISPFVSLFIPLTTGAWHFLRCWLDPADMKMKAQIDLGAISETVAQAAPTVSLSAYIAFGPQFDCEFSMDESGFFGEALSDGAATNIYNAGAGKTCCPFT